MPIGWPLLGNGVFYANDGICEALISSKRSTKATEMTEKSGNPNNSDAPATYHQGEARSAPYPVSRLAPAFGLVELAKEVAEADRMISGRSNAQLAQIAQQIKNLQAQARQVLETAHQDMQLHKARCNFKRIPGHIYHLYELDNGKLQFSMLSADDWGGQPPHTYLGPYRLDNDLSWTPAENPEPSSDPELLALLDLT